MVEFGLVETISIHALRKESDFIGVLYLSQINISIHALRKESDLMLRLGAECGLNFNPRSP